VQIKPLLKNIVPQWIRGQWGRASYLHNKRAPLLQRLLHDEPVSFVSFDDAFPQVEKCAFTPSCFISTPEILNVPFAQKTSHLRGPTLEVPEDFVAVLEDGLYSPGNAVVVSEERDVIDRSSNTAWVGNIFKRELYDRRPTPTTGYATPLRGPFNTFYHMLVECIPRLLALEQIPEVHEHTIQLLCTRPPSKTEAFYLGQLAFDTEVVLLEPGRLFRVEHLVFTPFKTPRFAGVVPARYANVLRERVCPDRLSRRSKRIFISRRKTGNRIILNRAALLQALRPYGFEEVILEDLSPNQQIQLFYDADMVVGSHGAGLSNLIFSPHAKVIEIFPSKYIVPHYYYMAKSLGLSYDFILGSENEYKLSTFSVDVDCLLSTLRKH